MTDQANEGTFVWESDKSQLSYENWYDKEPNQQGNEDCVHIRTNQNCGWNDFKCSQTKLGGYANTALCQKY